MLLAKYPYMLLFFIFLYGCTRLFSYSSPETYLVVSVYELL